MPIDEGYARHRARKLRGRILEVLYHRFNITHRRVELSQIQYHLESECATDDEIRSAIDYLIMRGLCTDATTRRDLGDKRPMSAVEITDNGISVAELATADENIVFE